MTASASRRENRSKQPGGSRGTGDDCVFPVSAAPGALRLRRGGLPSRPIACADSVSFSFSAPSATAFPGLQIGSRNWPWRGTVRVYSPHDPSIAIGHHDGGVVQPWSDWPFSVAAQDANFAEFLLQGVSGNGKAGVRGYDVAHQGRNRFHVPFEAAPRDPVVEGYLAVQVVVPREIVIGAVDLPYPADAGCAGKIAIGGEDRVLIADEAHHSGLPRPGSVHPVLVGKRIQDSRQRNGGEPGGCKSGKPAWSVPARRQPRRQVGAGQEPERNDGKDKTVLFVRLQGMDAAGPGRSAPAGIRSAAPGAMPPPRKARSIPGPRE